ncbi:Uncharacterised protein [Vibrio cholerae]|nr:Uncharacterised protein [Vibrio cholerae]
MARFFQRFMPLCERNCGLAISSTAKFNSARPVTSRVKDKQGASSSHQAPISIEDEVCTL